MAQDIVDTWLLESLQQGLEKGLQQGIQKKIRPRQSNGSLQRGGFSLEEIAFLVDGEISRVGEVSALWGKNP